MSVQVVRGAAGRRGRRVRGRQWWSRERARDVLRMEGEGGWEREREREGRGWVEGIISPMQIAFGLRLTEYTLEPARHRNLDRQGPPYFPRCGTLPFVRALKKFHHREPQLVTSPAESSRRRASFGKSLSDLARLARIRL